MTKPRKKPAKPVQTRIETTKSRQVTFYVDPTTYAAMIERATQLDRSLSWIAAYATHQYLKDPVL